jgi:hypothetical protein
MGGLDPHMITKLEDGLKSLSLSLSGYACHVLMAYFLPYA